MQVFVLLLHTTAAYPLACAWRANRRTTLLHAVNAAIVAWMGWLLSLLGQVLGWDGLDVLRYVALCLTGTAGVAVLGARRPGVQAWNFVLAGLLAVMLLPLAESLVAGRPLQVELPRGLFLAGTLGMILLNYLPTRLGLAALLLAASASVTLARLLGAHALEGWLAASQLGLALAPWLGLVLVRIRSAPLSEFDRLWLEFRDRFGLLWSQRLREQFNRAVENAGWPVVLRWNGLRVNQASANLESAADILATLRAILKRFGPDE